MVSPALISNAVAAARNADAAMGNYLGNWERSEPDSALNKMATELAPSANPLADALAIGFIVLGKRSAAQAKSLRTVVAGMSGAEAGKEFQAWMRFSLALERGTDATGEPILAPSFRHASSGDLMAVSNCFKRARAMINRAYIAAKAGVARDGAERQLMERWFGAYDATRFATVLGNLKLINAELYKKPVVLFYRGMRISGNLPGDKPNENGAATTSTAFASAFRATALPASYDRSFSYITLGQKFFGFSGGNVSASKPMQAPSQGILNRVAALNNAAGLQGGSALTAVAKRPQAPSTTISGNDSIGGVLLHELSHHLCNTKDEVHPGTGQQTYGTASCLTLATGWPALAINNADNYEYYCESFQ
jgi:hypothetical protein